MHIINNSIEAENFINNNSMCVLYFTGSRCGACEAIKLKIENILKSYPEIKSAEINGEKYLELASKYDIFSLPVFLLFIDKKETLRIGKNVDLLALEKDISRYYDLYFK